jgi:hypothetical protein
VCIDFKMLKVKVPINFSGTQGWTLIHCTNQITPGSQLLSPKGSDCRKLQAIGDSLKPAWAFAEVTQHSVKAHKFVSDLIEISPFFIA